MDSKEPTFYFEDFVSIQNRQEKKGVSANICLKRYYLWLVSTGKNN